MMMEAGVEANTISYNTVIKACAEAHDLARTEHWVSKMIEAGGEANTISYSTVIMACAEARDVPRAEHRPSAMQPK